MTKQLDAITKRYWAAYGGWNSVLRSRYLWTALLLTPLCWGSWGQPLWWDTIISVLPNLLGFTLGGFAIFVGFGDERFKASLAMPEEDPNQPTVYRELCATFVHFIFVQVIALLLALVSKGMWFKADLPHQLIIMLPFMNFIWGAICFAIFLYAITSVIAIGLHVFRIATMYETHQKFRKPDDVPNETVSTEVLTQVSLSAAESSKAAIEASRAAIEASKAAIEASKVAIEAAKFTKRDV